jgi:serine O-acetyltransferase
MGASDDFREDRARYGAHAWVREQSLWAVGVYRFGQWADERPSRLLRLVLGRGYWLAFRVVETATGISLTKECTIGGGLRIHHFGGIVIHPDAQIGRRCTLRHGVTIGERAEGAGVPTIGDGVEIGAYASILGPIRVGDGAKVGAHALVIRDVPDKAVVVAPEARVLE